MSFNILIFWQEQYFSSHDTVEKYIYGQPKNEIKGYVSTEFLNCFAADDGKRDLSRLSLCSFLFAILESISGHKSTFKIVNFLEKYGNVKKLEIEDLVHR